jgi:PAS domain S-box-containing protein
MDVFLLHLKKPVPFMRLVMLVRLLLLCAIFPVLAKGQQPDIQFEHLSMKDGLSMNPVMAIVQDKKGFLWFGTQDGLNRYDGYQIKVFKTKENDSLSLSDNFITSLVVDSSGNLWVGTLNGGLNRYDSRTGTFTRYQACSGLIPADNISCLLYDSEGHLWVGTEHGITLIDPKKCALLPLAARFPGLALEKSTSVLSIYRQKNGDVWIGTTGGALFYSLKDRTLKRYTNSPSDPSSLSNNIVLSFYEDKYREIWVGTLEGLNKFDKSSGRFKRTYFKELKKSSGNKESASNSLENIYSIVNNYGGNTIRTILEDDKGNFWIGTDMELIIYTPATGNFINYKKDLVNPTGINDHFIRSMYIDHSGNLWIGTLGNGLNKTSLNPKKFTHYQKKINDPRSLGENYVRSICEDAAGTIWVGTLVGGLNKFDPKTGAFAHYFACGNQSCPNDNNVWSLCASRSGVLWVGTNNGLNQFDPRSGTFRYFVHDEKNRASLSENTIRCVFEDRKGRLWIGTEGGLNLFNPASGTFTRFTRHDHPDSLSDNTVWKIIDDADGSLWLATNNGLNRFDPATRKFTKYFKKQGDANSLSHNGVRTLHIDSKGNLWLGTHNGLNKLNEVTGAFTRYDESAGLPNAFIYAIEEDEKGRLWLSTNKGLCCFFPESGDVITYDVFDGLQDYEFNTNASCVTKNGEMYFGGPNGLNRFHPLRLNVNNYNPRVEITAVTVKDAPLQAEEDVAEVKEITLQYDENILHFEFSSFDYTRPERNRYQYMMEGFNQGWVHAGNRRFTTYTNLDPGEYVFRVRGTNADGVWSSNEDSIRIIILPPFWKTKWFYALVALFLISLAYLIYRVRVAGLRKEKLLLEQKVKERTYDLEEEKRKIERINQELEKLSIVVSKTDNAVVIANRDGIIEWINDSLLKMYSKNISSPESIYGRSIVSLSSNPDMHKVLDTCLRDKISVSYESESTNREGKMFWVQSTLTPILNEQGEVSKLVIIDADITERKHAEEIIREKNKNITDSINYAVRIQSALLPDEGKMSDLAPDSFVLFRPRDIVSGDFYFMESIRTNEGALLTGFAVGDCTGHGVPGALMSMIGTSFLKQSLHEKSVNSPAQALDYVSAKINDMFGNQGGGIIRDGMDISFCVFNPASLQLYFAGAGRPCVIIGEEGLREIKGDSRAVGYSESADAFANHAVQLRKGDCVYLFSDGYADQFGGPRGKKFKYKRLLETLQAIAKLPMKEQHATLEKTFSDWKGELEQVDDVLVLGIRV